MIEAIFRAIAYGAVRGYLDAMRDESAERETSRSDDSDRAANFRASVERLRSAENNPVGINPTSVVATGNGGDMGAK